MRTNATSSFKLLSGDFRIDASYHVSSGQLAIEQLTHSGKKLEHLEKVCLPKGIYIPGRFKRIFVDDPQHGAPYITGGSIFQAEPILGAKLLSFRHTSNMSRLALREKMILITCSGEIGNSVYVNGVFQNSVGSPDLIRVLADPKKIPSGYLYAYLSSPQARALIQQKTYGAVIPHIEAHHITDLTIPRLPIAMESHIHQLIEKAAELRTKANSLIADARSQLLTVNNLAPLSTNDYYFYGNGRRSLDSTGTFVVSSKDLSTLTINAWNYADKFAGIRRRIMAGNNKKLSDVILADGYRTGRSFKRIPMPTGNGIEFIGQKDLFGLRKVGKWISQIPIGSLDSEVVSNNTILLAGVGTNAETEVFGRCEFVWNNFEGKIPAAEIIRIDGDQEKIDPGYLYTFLSSEYGFRLLRSMVTGTKLCRFIEPLVMDLPIPLPNKKSDMTKIGDMVRDAYDNRAKALNLEDQAQALLQSSLGVSNRPVVQ